MIGPEPAVEPRVEVAAQEADAEKWIWEKGDMTIISKGSPEKAED